MNERKNNRKKASSWKSVQFGLAILFGLIVYAYGFQVTKVGLEDLRSEDRQERMVRVIRALARPDIFEYEQETEIVNAPVYVTCPTGGNPTTPEPDKTKPNLLGTPTYANAGGTVQ